MSCSKSDSPDSDEYEGLTLLDLNERIYAGGATTIFSENSLAYSVAAPNLTEAEDDKHTIGDRAFETTFVTNPAPVYGGLGPIFNSNSCISCHPGDGRAAFPTDLERSRGFFMRVSLPGTDACSRLLDEGKYSWSRCSWWPTASPWLRNPSTEPSPHWLPARG